MSWAIYMKCEAVFSYCVSLLISLSLFLSLDLFMFKSGNLCGWCLCVCHSNIFADILDKDYCYNFNAATSSYSIIWLKPTTPRGRAEYLSVHLLSSMYCSPSSHLTLLVINENSSHIYFPSNRLVIV